MGNQMTTMLCSPLLTDKPSEGCFSSLLIADQRRPSLIKKPNNSRVGPTIVDVQPLKVNTLVQNLPNSTAATAAKRKTSGDKETISITTTTTIIITEQAQDNSKSVSMRDREIIAKCWRTHIQLNRQDIFHRTMLFCIEASPKLNEIIACQRYCYRDLTKWPKLDKICRAQFNFFEKLIYELEMDEQKVRQACTQLGQTHAGYAQYGMKPHFLDIFHQQLLGLISNLPFADPAERSETVAAFNRFISLIMDAMIQAYAKEQQRERKMSKEKSTF